MTTPAERFRCLDCGCFVPTETVEGGKAAEYDEWSYYGECSKCGGGRDVWPVSPSEQDALTVAKAYLYSENAEAAEQAALRLVRAASG